MPSIKSTSRESKVAQIEKVARSIEFIDDCTTSDNYKAGSLLVIGSGLSLRDFTLDSEKEIISADTVLYCIYDKLTQIWINRLRPDALDLSAFYSVEVDRYHTYIQMAEVILHHVRLGQRVVAIYYGHPGIFAMPAHRAIHIARREGHRAQMRPGISALDYLVADLGIDPAIPGMLNFEATDMLLRNRKIDPSLHVVLWQVGVVGEFGYDPRGFKNHGFDILVDALERIYGSDWLVTNYVASHFPSVDPVIETFPIGALRKIDIRQKIQSMSTFYIAPKEASATNEERSINLGLTTPEQPVQPPMRFYDNNQYGQHERTAIGQLKRFAVPAHFSLPEPTPVASLLLDILLDADLHRCFIDNPDNVLSGERCANLTDRERKLLSIPHALAMETVLYEADETAKLCRADAKGTTSSFKAS